MLTAFSLSPSDAPSHSAGIDQTNPPSGLKMMKLLANSDFRKLTMDLQELMTNKGLDVKVRSRHRAVCNAGRSDADPSSPFWITVLCLCRCRRSPSSVRSLAVEVATERFRIRSYEDGTSDDPTTFTLLSETISFPSGRLSSSAATRVKFLSFGEVVSVENQSEMCRVGWSRTVDR